MCGKRLKYIKKRFYYVRNGLRIGEKAKIYLKWLKYLGNC